MSDSVQPHRGQPARLSHPLDFPGKSTGVGYHCLLRNLLQHIIFYDNMPSYSFTLLWLTSIPFGEGSGTPLQYSSLENPMDRGAWWAAVHGVARSRTQLSDFTFTFHFHALEKEMATHSSVLARRIPGTEEPGGLLSMGSHRVGHD